MDTQNTEGKADKTRSGPATGYATDVVDAALKIAETRETRNASARHAACKVIDSQSLPDWNYDQASLTILADEVRRLRAEVAGLENKLGWNSITYGGLCADIVDAVEKCGLPFRDEDGVSYELSEHLPRVVAEVVRLKSHNEVAE